MIAGILCVILVGALFGLAIQKINDKASVQSSSKTKLINEVNALLPQLQCGKCNYPGCLPYAEAIIVQHARIDLCPPGGEATLKQLADFLQTEPPETLPFATHAQKEIAFIDSASCIGCTLCLPVCPTDAIVGSQRHLHHIIDSYCVGCGLCVDPCPVNCIDMRPAS